MIIIKLNINRQSLTNAIVVDKGALCLTMSAFDMLPDDQFAAFMPFLHGYGLVVC